MNKLLTPFVFLSIAALVGCGGDDSSSGSSGSDENVSGNVPDISLPNSSHQSSAACFNPELYKDGLVVRSKYLSKVDGIEDIYSSEESKVETGQTFGGNRDLIKETLYNLSYNGVNSGSLSVGDENFIGSNYIKFDENYGYIYGTENEYQGRKTVDIFDKPLRISKIKMAPGETFYPDFNKSYGVPNDNETYEGREIIKTTVGNYEACKFSVDVTAIDDTIKDYKIYAWIFAEGPYRGIEAKQTGYVNNKVVSTFELQEIKITYK